MTDEKNLGDVPAIPHEFTVIKEGYENKIRAKQIDLHVLRQVGGSDYMEQVDYLIGEIRNLKGKLKEITQQIQSLTANPGGNDDNKHNG